MVVLKTDSFNWQWDFHPFRKTWNVFGKLLANLRT